MSITEDQAKVYTILVNLALKTLLVLASLVAFFWILTVLLTKGIEWDWRKATAYVALDGLLAGSMYKVVKHYFPALKETTN